MECSMPSSRGKTPPSRTDRVGEIARQFEREIVQGERAPGDLLPSEREISARLGVSRSVVREALGRLASLGLVTSVRGSGTRVAPPDCRQATVGFRRLLSRGGFRLEQLSDVRLPLETAIVALAAIHRTEEHLERLRRTQVVLANPKSTLDAQVKADIAFHSVLAEATGNPLFGIVLAPIQERLIESRRQTLGRYGADIAYNHHGEILTAVARRDPAAASQAMRDHIQANTGHLQRLDRVEG
jgi:DNA-binding FadR family transcriptional regulator